jgi:FG-GAP-like repeat
MGVRMVVLSLLIAAAAGAMVMAGPPMLVPASGSPLSLGPGPSNVAISDINGDGTPDLVVTGRERRVTILLGKGDGRFSSTRDGTLDVPENPSELALGDVNGDGHVDLALASHDGYNVVLLLGDGRGRFRIAPGSPVVMKDGRQPHTHGLAIADVNHDGKADLVTVNSNDDNDVAVMLGDGQGGFTRAPGVALCGGSGPVPPCARRPQCRRPAGRSGHHHRISIRGGEPGSRRPVDAAIRRWTRRFHTIRHRAENGSHVVCRDWGCERRPTA